MKRIFAFALCATLSACGGGDGGGAGQGNAAYAAPATQPPAVLDPDPPMSGADIDAIVNETRGQVAAPDAGGNVGGAAGGNAADAGDATKKGN